MQKANNNNVIDAIKPHTKERNQIIMSKLNQQQRTKQAQQSKIINNA